MCFGGGGGSPPPVQPPVEPAKDTREVVRSTRQDLRRRAALLASFSGTNTTGGQGLITPANTARRTLLGGG